MCVSIFKCFLKARKDSTGFIIFSKCLFFDYVGGSVFTFSFSFLGSETTVYVILHWMWNTASPIRKKPVFLRATNTLRIMAHWSADPKVIRDLIQSLTTEDLPKQMARVIDAVRPPSTIEGNVNFSLHLPMIGADEEPKVVNGKRVLKMSVQRKQRFFKTYFFVGFVVPDNSILIFTQLSDFTSCAQSPIIL